ncbi:MAG TPA: IS1595 family transposase [Candidatus Acidoferrales bacterium]|nr:IS1595 family transposase [Candidatus Acidoferrales bacterium]
MANPILTLPHFHNEEAAFAYVESHLWPEGPTCPHCGNVDQKAIGRLTGKSSRPGLRKCYACRKTFTVRIGSIFEDSHFSLHLWLQAIQLIVASKKGISTRQIQRTFNCSMKTAWFLTHRIREIMKPANDGVGSPVGGEGQTVEADFTYVGRKPGTKVRHGHGHMNPVLSLVERDGSARSFHMPTVRANALHALIGTHASPKSKFMTDEANMFTEIGWNFASHGSIQHSKDEYVRGDVHTNTVEGFFSILKRGVYGVYQHISEAHLHRYLYEFDFRYSNREKLGVNDTARASIALKGAKGRRLTYETTH